MSKLYPCRATISRLEYLSLVGLLTLAKEHNRQLKYITEGVQAILKPEAPDDGHGPDAVYCDYTAERLLELMEITVEKE